MPTGFSEQTSVRLCALCGLELAFRRSRNSALSSGFLPKSHGFLGFSFAIPTYRRAITGSIPVTPSNDTSVPVIVLIRLCHPGEPAPEWGFSPHAKSTEEH